MPSFATSIIGSIGCYVFRVTFNAFLVVVVTLITVFWLTQSLRSLDLITSQGQTILVFIGITSLIIPQLFLIIGPISFMIAIVYALHKMTADSEIIIINAAGSSPWLLFRSLAMVAVVVSASVAIIGAYVSPKCIRELRHWAAEVRADLVANIVQPGRFTTVENGLTFHIRARQSDGTLRGILIDDARDPAERATILAEQGEIVKKDKDTFLVLENGSVQRHSRGQSDPKIVAFDSYAFDLSHFGSGAQNLNSTVEEQYLWDLFSPKATDPTYVKQPGSFRAELHDRLTAPIYPLAFLVIVYAYLGAPRTSRQGNGILITTAVLTAVALRTVGFLSLVLSPSHPVVLILPYAVLLLTFVLGSTTISRGGVIAPRLPAIAADGLTNLRGWLLQRFANLQKGT